MMKKFNFLYIFFVIAILFPISNLRAATRLLTPDALEIKELNKEQKNKLQNIQYSETQSMPNQYKGKLKYTEGKEDVYLKDVRLFFGIGGRYTLSRDVTLSAEASPQDTTYFNSKNKFNFDSNFNFYGSIGAYWRNGVRIEFEYSQITFDSTDYAKDFARYKGIDPAGQGKIFNQYLQKTGNINNFYNTSGDLVYTTLTNNNLPKIDFEVRTYMVNFIFEKTTIKSKLRPYIGIGVGLVEGDMKTLVSDGSDTVLGGQIMVGLSYAFANDALAVYLGYRGMFAQEMEQTFTRVVGVTGYSGRYFDGSIYYNPQFFKSKEKYKFQCSSVDLGIRFFF